ncbi:hypothetical protein [Burkholderia glumae]|uniref:hypothetical protein n=1 Tax=Burkholderia glumae TaxID=337 RepID=UPI002151C536|nr:hypothetical protein [Burkholderia glumae]
MRFVFAVFQLLRVLMMSAHSGARAALDVLRNSGASAPNGEPDGKEIGDRTMHFLRAEAAALGISVEQLVHRMFLIFSVEDVELMQASDTDDVLNIDGASPGDVRRQAESLAGFDALPDHRARAHRDGRRASGLQHGNGASACERWHHCRPAQRGRRARLACRRSASLPCVRCR